MKCNRRERPGAHGFTILDVLIAILLMTIAITGLSAMQLVSISANARARELAEATQLCQAKVEELRTLSLPLPLPPLAGEVLDARGCLLAGDTRSFCSTAMPGTRYTRSWTIDPADPSSFQVQTQWRGTDGQIHSTVISGAR